MIIFSGGTGTPKLLDGLRTVFPESELTVVVNTAEDLEVSGNLISPDLDTVLYLLSDRIDRKKWWGVEGDTFRTHERMKELGIDEGMMIGDLDRATHILRSAFLKEGDSLTEATEKLAALFEVKASVLPMSDAPVSTFIETPEAPPMHFQDFWVGKHGEPDILKVDIRGLSKAAPSEKVLETLEKDDLVLIGPSNPITSIGPILGLKNMRELLKEKTVMAISPIISNAPISGPAGKLMEACGLEVSSFGVAEHYQDFLDFFIFDERDSAEESAFESLGCGVARADTLMTSQEKSAELASFVLEIFEELA